MNRAQFRQLVKRAVDGLPEWVKPHLENVEIVVEDRPSGELLESLDMDPEEDSLFGFYDGVPLTEKSNWAMDGDAPVFDTIYVFQKPLEEEFPERQELIEQIRVTVVHEVGHHLGLEDDRIDELGYG